MKKLVTIVIAALAGQLLADTITWTGGAGTYGWGNAGNWDLNRVPGETDEVVIDGDITVSRGGNNLVISSLTLLNGATVEGVNELKSEGDATSPVYTGGRVSCSLVALLTGPVTISDAEIANSGTAHNAGFYRANGYLNFVDGAEGAAKYTFQSSLSSNPYTTFFSGTTPLIRYNGANIDETTYNSKFQATDNGDGTTTLSFKVLTGWEAGAVSVDSVADGEASVSFTVTKYSGGNATVSIGCASSDLGDDIADWAGKLTQVATGVSATTSYNETVTLADGFNYIRVFVAYDSTTVASPAAVARSIAYGDYGALTGVYEYIGSDGNLSTASNWALDKVPLGASDTAPIAGTDIRWFGSNTVFALSGAFHLYATDHYVGATITQASAGNRDSNLNGDVTFENSSVTLSTVVVQSEPHVISLKNSNFATTRAPDGVAGFWTTVPVGGINFVSGFPSSFSFGADSGDVHDADTVKSQLVNNGKITLDGSAIDDTTWTQFFSVDVAGTTVTVSYSPTVAENRIDEVSASSTSTSATLTATIGAQEAGTIVKFAYGTSAPTDADVLAGTVMTVTDGSATGSASGLTDLTVYHFTVAIVDAESTEILASKSGQFVASDFAYVYMNGAWAGDVPALNTDSQVLFLDSYSTANGDVNVGNKTVIGTSLLTGTLTGHGPLVARSAQISNTRNNDLNGAPYGTWNVTAPLFDFNSLSSNGTIRAACSYTFYTKHSDEDIYGEFFKDNAPLIHVNGSPASQDDFSIQVLGTYNPGEENEYRRVLLAWWEPFPASERDADWTVRPGARVKLTKNTRIGSLDIPVATDVKIDLNGYELKVSSLTIEGEKKKGEFTAETLPAILIGEGKLVVTWPGSIYVVR